MTRTQQLSLLAGMQQTDGRVYRVREPRYRFPVLLFVCAVMWAFVIVSI